MSQQVAQHIYEAGPLGSGQLQRQRQARTCPLTPSDIMYAEFAGSTMIFLIRC